MWYIAPGLLASRNMMRRVASLKSASSCAGSRQVHLISLHNVLNSRPEFCLSEDRPCAARTRGPRQVANAGSALCEAASTADLEYLKRLLENGVDPNLGDYDKRTALHVAAAEGQQKVRD